MNFLNHLMKSVLVTVVLTVIIALLNINESDYNFSNLYHVALIIFATVYSISGIAIIIENRTKK